jgi:phosphoribosylglycinamide formyltransferase-1
MTAMTGKKKIAVLVSGGGTNLQALIDAKAAGQITGGEFALVVASKPGVYALERAEKAGIPAKVLERKAFPDVHAYSIAMRDTLLEAGIDIVVYAGFLTILDESVCDAFPGRMINVHPALIPSFSGKGFYGLRVHEAALARGVKVTGATVHIFTSECDGGPILLQKAVEVHEGDTPETLQKRVMEEAEWVILPKALEILCKQEEENA